MAEILTLYEGTERLSGTVPALVKPRLVALYSPGQNHGKSYFTKMLNNRLYKTNGIFLYRHSCDNFLSGLDEDMIDEYDGHLLDMPPNLSSIIREFSDNSASDIFGKKIDFHVFIFRFRKGGPSDPLFTQRFCFFIIVFFYF